MHAWRSDSLFFRFSFHFTVHSTFQSHTILGSRTRNPSSSTRLLIGGRGRQSLELFSSFVAVIAVSWIRQRERRSNPPTHAASTSLLTDFRFFSVSFTKNDEELSRWLRENWNSWTLDPDELSFSNRCRRWYVYLCRDLTSCRFRTRMTSSDVCKCLNRAVIKEAVKRRMQRRSRQYHNYVRIISTTWHGETYDLRMQDEVSSKSARDP